MEKFRVSVSPKELTVDPGGQITMTLVLRNLSDIVDQYRIDIIGIEPSWFRLSVQSVSLFPQDQDQLTVIVSPPRSPYSRAGTHRSTIKVTSREFKEESTVDVTLQVGPFFAYAVNLAPQQQTTRSAGQFSLVFENKGNVAVPLTLSAEDPERGCTFEFKETNPTLPPGEKAEVALTVQPKKRRLMGAPVRYPFDVTTTPQGYEDQKRTTSGQLTYRPLIPPWLPPTVLALVALLVVVFMLLPGRWPAIDKFVAEREVITHGEPVVLAWRVRNAREIEIGPGVAAGPLNAQEGQVTVRPPAPGTYKFTLVARSGDRVVERPVSVTVRWREPRIVLFKASRAVERKQEIALKWKVEDARSGKIEPDVGSVALEGGLYVRFPNTDQPVFTYRITAVNPDHGPVTAEATVQVNVVIIRFDAQPAEIDRGGKVRLEWNVLGATRVQLDPIGLVPAPSGTYDDAPTQTTVYRLRASNERGSATREVKVVVHGPTTPPGTTTTPPGTTTTRPGTTTTPPGTTTSERPFIKYFRATPTRITPGAQIQLCWSVVNARAIRIEPSIGPLLSADACQPISPLKTTTYTLSALGVKEQKATRKVTVNVYLADPDLKVEFRPSKTSVSPGERISLCYKILNALSAQIDPGVGRLRPSTLGQGGSCVRVNPRQTTTYVLRVRGRRGMLFREVTVRVRKPGAQPR